MRRVRCDAPRALVRRIAAVLCLACGVAPALSATIGIAMPPPAAAIRPLLEGIAEQAKAHDVTVAYAHAPDGAGTQQVAQVRQLIAAKVDALLIAPVEASARSTLTRIAQEADIPLVFLDGSPPDPWSSGRIASVRPHDLVAGRLQMRKLAHMLNGTGRLALIAGSPAHAGSALRLQGIKDVLAGFPGLQPVADGAADGDRGKARALVAGWLANHIRIDAIAAANDAMALGAADAVEAAGIPPGRILIGGVDATAEGLIAMQRKRLAVTVYQDSGLQGRRAVDTALAMMRREPVRHIDWLPVELITDRMSTTHFAR
jgi:ABC-type sugar transport system substrate-binding protein